MTITSLPSLDLGTLERLAIELALQETNGNRVSAARLLGIHVRTLHRKLRELEVAGIRFDSVHARHPLARERGRALERELIAV